MRPFTKAFPGIPIGTSYNARKQLFNAAVYSIFPGTASFGVIPKLVACLRAEVDYKALHGHPV